MRVMVTEAAQRRSNSDGDEEPDLMRLVLHASVAALVNVQSVEVVDAEMKRRAVMGN